MRSGDLRRNRRYRHAGPTFPIRDILAELAPNVEVPQNGGGWIKMHCPVHDDTHTSADINHGAHVFYCFTCRISAGAIGLLMQQEGLDIGDAVTRAEAITGNKGQQIREQPRRKSSLLSRLTWNN